MTTFLLKTEPDAYSWDDLKRDRTTPWDGVSNNAALKFMRSAVKGDRAYFYHTGDVRAIVGLCTISTAPYEDPGRPGLTAAGKLKYPLFDVTYRKAARTPVTLGEIKADERFAMFDLVRQSRLSVMPVPDDLASIIDEWAGF